MHQIRSAAVAALAAAWLAVPTAALAETCLDRFSCKLHGECRLPCLDDVLGTKPAAPPATAALGAQPAASPPGSSAGRGTKAHAAKAKPKVAHRDAARSKSADKAADKGEKVRLVAAKSVGSLDQLAGKPVSFGPAGSPAQRAGRQLFARLGIKVEETPLDLDNALDGVATGDVAAVVVSAPGDAGKVDKLAKPEVHALPIPAGAVARGG